MPLIPTTPTLTPAEATAARIRNIAKELHVLQVMKHQEMYQEVWKTLPPSFDVPAPTAEEVIAALGTDAAALFVAGSKLVDLILLGNPDALTPEEYLPQQTVTLNEDGTVTLTPFEE